MSIEQRRRLFLWLLALSLFLPLLIRKGCKADHIGTPAAFFVDGRDIAIRIDGNVMYPGVYKFHDAPRVVSVINLAGGYRMVPELDRNLLQRRLRSGDAIKVVDEDNVAAIRFGRMETTERIALGLALPINEMETDDWEKMPGVGPHRAREIINYRQINGGFESFDELSQVPGIGKKTMSDLKPFFSPQ